MRCIDNRVYERLNNSGIKCTDDWVDKRLKNKIRLLFGVC